MGRKWGGCPAPDRDHLTPLVSAGTIGTGGTKPENTGIQVVPVAESGPGPTGPLKTGKVLFGPGGPGTKTGTGTSKSRLNQGRVPAVPVVPPKNRVPGPVRDRDHHADPVARILARLNLGGRVAPEPDFTAPAPTDVERIRETVKSWPRSFAQGWAELVVSAMVAGRGQHEAERLAFRPLAEDAPLYQAETAEAPGPWPPRPWR